MSKWIDNKKEWTEKWPDINPIVLQYLFQMEVNIEKVPDLYSFDYESGLHDPFLLPDMKLGVNRILKSINDNEKIIVFGDYDADGLPGVTILHRFFEKVGFDNFEIKIPNRNIEGFGLKPIHADEIISSEANLVITVDCGSASVEALQKLSATGIDVIVTDHHQVPDNFEDNYAVAMINPMKKGSNYPFKELCGAAVVFKLVQALIMEGEFDLVDGWEKWLLDLVAISTVGDMMPITGENRIFVHFGLKVLNKTPDHGLRALIDSARLKRGEINEVDIAFRLAPRINAASRIGGVEIVIDLLTANNPINANKATVDLENLNSQRKKVVTQMVKTAHKKLGAADEYDNNVVVVGDATWLPGMCGLLASRLVDEYGKSAFVWGRGPAEKIKGSCRAAVGDNVYEIMKLVPDEIIDSYGGHIGAGGFVLHSENVHKFLTALESALGKINQSPTDIDINSVAENNIIEISPEDITEDLLVAVNNLGPFGIGFRAPIFKIECMPKFKTFGKGDAHLKIEIDKNLSGVMWRTKLEDLDYTEGQRCSIIGSIEFDDYIKRPRLSVESIESI